MGVARRRCDVKLGVTYPCACRVWRPPPGAISDSMLLCAGAAGMIFLDASMMQSACRCANDTSLSDKESSAAMQYLWAVIEACCMYPVP